MKYWIYQPGEKARYWDEFKSENIIALGWDHLGDLNQFDSKAAIAEKLRGQTNSSKKNDATANWDFYSTMQVGDIVIVKRGRRTLLGYGEVVSDYYYDPNRKEYTSIRQVKWIKTGVWTVSFDLVLKTLTNITKYESEISEGIKYYDYLLSIMNDDMNYRESFKLWLSTKTKDTSNRVSSYIKAIDILCDKLDKNIYKIKDTKYLDELYADLIIHQSDRNGKYYFEKAKSYGQSKFYSSAIREYKQFHIEFRNKEIENAAKLIKMPLNQILYGPPGTGKTYNTINKAVSIANPSFDLSQDRAIIRAEYHRLVEIGQIVFTTFHQSMSYEDFIEGIKPLKPESDDTFIKYDIIPGVFKSICDTASKKRISYNNFEMAYQNLLKDIDASPNKSLVLETLIHSKEFTIYKNSRGNIKFHANTEKAYEGVIRKEIIEHFLKTGETLDWSSYTKALGKFIIENYHYKQEEVKSEDKSYVLIIDEINRGNVSAIFGELITLIEESKRADAEEALEITLPYSKEKFSVPSNLYIIGTMNTADRSVEALDTALRRRFVFEEMLPKPDLEELDYEVYGYKASAILKRINLRIEKLVDRDHCIGHAYFIGKNEETIIDSFYKNIIPLLQEYFFGDYGKIGLVLGKGFVRLKQSESALFADFSYEYKEDLENRTVYEIIDYRNGMLDVKGFGQAIAALMNNG